MEDFTDSQINLTSSTKKTKDATSTLSVTEEPSGSQRLRDREEKVRSALERFVERTKGVNKEMITAQFEKVAAAKERFAQIPTPKPVEEVEVDEFGHSWVKLTYKNGEIRYELGQE